VRDSLRSSLSTCAVNRLIDRHQYGAMYASSLVRTTTRTNGEKRPDRQPRHLPPVYRHPHEGTACRFRFSARPTSGKNISKIGRHQPKWIMTTTARSCANVFALILSQSNGPDLRLISFRSNLPEKIGADLFDISPAIASPADAGSDRSQDGDDSRSGDAMTAGGVARCCTLQFRIAHGVRF
jgi:hypothetical protein